VLQAANGRSLLELKLETGRTHQIRAHLKALGCPVAGDFLYGREMPSLPGRFALHSCRVRLRHPFTGAEVLVESPLPRELAALILDVFSSDDPAVWRHP
jgi:23S rRNA-/tRNA-specific pseudouridylate synthase